MDNILNMFGLLEIIPDYEWIHYLARYSVMIIFLSEVFAMLKALLFDVFMRKW